jgi:hypothetical protein
MALTEQPNSAAGDVPTITNKMVENVVQFLVATAMRDGPSWDVHASPQEAWRFNLVNEMREQIQPMLQPGWLGHTHATPVLCACCVYCHDEIDRRLQMLVKEVDHGLSSIIPWSMRDAVQKGVIHASMRWDSAWYQKKHHITPN